MRETRTIPGISRYNGILQANGPGAALTARGLTPKGLTSMPSHDTPETSPNVNTSGLCRCGCGGTTRPARFTNASMGYVRGQPIHYIRGHNARPQAVDMRIDGDVAFIPVYNGRDSADFAIVDIDAVDLVMTYTWHARRSGRTSYAECRVPPSIDVQRRTISMHRLILGLDFGSGMVDHINGDGLDNRRSNLRLCDRSQNSVNRVMTSKKSSRFRGVAWKRNGRWHASIGYQKRKLNLGVYRSELDAANAYDDASRKYFGEFATLNFPRSGERSALTGEIEP